MAVNIFRLLDLLEPADVNLENSDNAIPDIICTALRKNEYTDEVAHAIENLDEDTFYLLRDFIMSDKIEALDVKFHLPIIRNLFAHMCEFSMSDTLFAWMGLCLRKPIDCDFGIPIPDLIIGIIGGKDDDHRHDSCGENHGACDGNSCDGNCSNCRNHHSDS